MDIRQAIPTDREALLDVWMRSVRATHAFLPEGDIQAMIPQVRDYLASGDSEFWVLCDPSGAVMGFMGMSGSRMESLFLAPEFQRRGAGRRLVRHAQALHGELTVDVNEQNAAARDFYAACGFVVEGRSPVDGQGRPYPLLHMRLAAPNAAVSTGRLLSADARTVFAAFARPERLARWWGPSGFTNTFERFEFRPGGRWVFVMHGPNGADYPNESVFREILPDARIVIEHVGKPWYRLTVTLTPRGDRTHLAWVQEFESPEVAAKMRRLTDTANEQNLDRLESLLADETA